MRQGGDSTTIIVTTYNRPDALQQVLTSLMYQRHAPDEVIIADDGSGPQTARCIATWQARVPFHLKHVWQPDKGFRAGAARNRAVASSNGSYLMFLDGDCLVFPDFVARHFQLAEASCFVIGNRILLGRELTAAILRGMETPLRWPWHRWLLARAGRQVNRVLPLLTLPDGAWRKYRRRMWQGAQTCNLALARRDFLAVNGFDEEYQGWGHEDADLIVRLIHYGCSRKDGRFALPVLHLWHEGSDRSNEQANVARLRRALHTPEAYRGRLGIDRYTYS
jgi:glycosyltransferase involved in cell wall biosynthesis